MVAVFWIRHHVSWFHELAIYMGKQKRTKIEKISKRSTKNANRAAYKLCRLSYYRPF